MFGAERYPVKAAFAAMFGILNIIYMKRISRYRIRHDFRI
jgi:hypothetical protein